jgi:hypothetical protein
MTVVSGHGPSHWWRDVTFIIPDKGPVKGWFSVRKERAGKA